MNNNAHVFVPLYNLEPTTDILNKCFNGWKLVDNKTYFNKYKKYFQKQKSSFNWDAELDAILQIPQAGMLYTHPMARYTLVKRLNLLPYIDQASANFNQQCINKVLDELSIFIIVARLVKKGNLQIGKYYILSKTMYESANLSISTTTDAIDNFIYRGRIGLKNYKLDKVALSKINRFSQNFTFTIEKLFIPINYFCEYYSAKNIYDKTLKLITVLECVLLGDRCSELKYTLQVRACTFLNKNISEILRLAYDIRSKICHTGIVPLEEIKRIKKLISNSNDIEMDVDYILLFLRDCLEETVREILIKAITLIKRKNIEIKDITRIIDDVLLKKEKSV